MKKITIINAYGDKNIGDAAILTVALQFIREAYKNKCEISVLCEDTKSLSNFIESSNDISVLQLPYGYAIRGNKRVSHIVKFFRFLLIYVCTFSVMMFHKYFKIGMPAHGFYSYIKEIRDSDVIVGMGGGYFTTTDKIKDYFGLLLSLLTVYVAKFYHRKIIFFPISFGPFASSTQEYITYKTLTQTTIMSRDEISLNQIQTLDKKNEINTFYAPDLALFLEGVESNRKTKFASHYIVLTAREWFSDKLKQDLYERSLIKFINVVYSTYALQTVFIPMGRNPIEDDDNRVAIRINDAIKDNKVFIVKNPDSIKHLQSILSGAKISVCTRMHSAILSSTVGTPFIAIGYGHKTLGFTKSFGLEKWHIDICDVDENNLFNIFNKLVVKNNYVRFSDELSKKINSIKKYRSKIINTLNLTYDP